MIEKVIHYCWFGGNEKNAIINQCIDSWKKHCPDYKIVEWNENNFDVNFCNYSAEAYKEKKWAFVSDIARIKIIYENGGIYLDTDVELYRSLDPLLKYEAWFAQDDIRYINTGLGFGAEKGNSILDSILQERMERKFDFTICNAVDTPIIKRKLSMVQSRESQIYGLTYIVGMNEYSTYARHYEGNSWKDEDDRKFQLSRKNRHWKLKCFLRNPQIINRLEKNGETKWSKLYVFMVYDLLDNGFIYFLKRFIRKIRTHL